MDTKLFEIARPFVYKRSLAKLLSSRQYFLVWAWK